MTRYAGPARINLNPPAARPHVDAGRKLAGELEARGLAVGVAHQTLSDGTRLVATKHGSQRAIAINTPPPAGEAAEAMEEIIFGYLSSPGGLRIFDLGRKALVQTITGLDPYEVDEVAPGGKLVYMAGEGVAVRVDLSDLSAFSYGYTVDTATTPASGIAFVETSRLSPDSDRLLTLFGRTYTEGGVLIEGVPGVLLTDAETLAPLRPAIRMCRRKITAAWAPQGDVFALTTALAADAGDVSNPGVFTSTADYLALFDKDGVLQGTRQLGTWGFTPDAGFASLISALTLSGTRAYVAYEPDFLEPAQLAVIDYREAGLPVVATLALPVHAGQQVRALCLTYGGSRLAAWYTETGGADSRVVEYAIDGDELTLLHDTQDSRFTVGAAWSGSFSDSGLDHAIRRGPKSRVGQPPDPRRWMLAHRDAPDSRLYAYRKFDSEPVYEFDFLGHDIGTRYALAAVGARKREIR